MTTCSFLFGPLGSAVDESSSMCCGKLRPNLGGGRYLCSALLGVSGQSQGVAPDLHSGLRLLSFSLSPSFFFVF